jgi:hypothetical protein
MSKIVDIAVVLLLVTLFWCFAGMVLSFPLPSAGRAAVILVAGLATVVVVGIWWEAR